MPRLRSRAQVLAVMRRVGLGDRLEQAEALLPETVDLDRDRDLLVRIGIDPNVDELTDRLGGSP
jgi:hypothetical protein